MINIVFRIIGSESGMAGHFREKNNNINIQICKTEYKQCVDLQHTLDVLLLKTNLHWSKVHIGYELKICGTSGPSKKWKNV